MGTALFYCCGCLSSSVDITLAPTRYCPNIDQNVQDLGCKQTQQFRCPSGTGQVFWLLYSTRVARASKKTPTRMHKLSEKTPLPSKDVILKYVANRIQINHLICKLTMNDQEFLDKVTSHSHTPDYSYVEKKQCQLQCTEEDTGQSFSCTQHMRKQIYELSSMLFGTVRLETHMCHFRLYKCVCTTRLPLPKAWFLSRSNDATLSKWKGLCWYLCNCQEAL